MIILRALAIACLTALPAGAATTMDARFDLSLRGVTGGQIAIQADETGGGYSVSALARATGMVGALVRYGYEGQAKGTLAGPGLEAGSYTEIEVDDGERTVATTRFRNARPVGVTFTPPREPQAHDIEPASASGVIDPLSALYAVLRPVPAAEACAQRHDLFDGRHVSRLTLGAAEAGAGGTIRCSGEYRRLRGYAPRKMEERPRVPLTFVYAPDGGGRMQVVEIRSPTRLGDAVLRRR